MGYEIVYCGGCRRQLRGPEFERGGAYRLKNQAFCKACAPKVVRTLPPDLMQDLLEQIAQSTRKAKAAPAQGKPGPRGAAARRPALLWGGVAAAALLIVVPVSLSLGRPGPEAGAPKTSAAAKPPPALPPTVPPAVKPPPMPPPAVSAEPAAPSKPPPASAPRREPEILEFSPVADVILDEKQPVTPLGKSPYLGCEEEEDQRRYSFLRFQLSGLPAGATVLEAELRMHCSSGSAAGGVLRFFKPEDPEWDESKATWSSPLKGRDASGDISGVGQVEVGKPAVWTGLAHPLLANGPVTLVLRSTSPKGCAYRSKEWTLAQERPVLRVKFTRS